VHFVGFVIRIYYDARSSECLEMLFIHFVFTTCILVKCEISEFVLNLEVFYLFACISCCLKHEYDECSMTTDCVPLRTEDDWHYCL